MVRYAYDSNPITVYQRVKTVEETCDLGHKHFVTYYAPKRLGPVFDFAPMDHGYYVKDTPMRKDAQGRVYHYKEAIDYYGGGSWIRQGDNALFDARERSKHDRMITLG